MYIKVYRLNGEYTMSPCVELHVLPNNEGFDVREPDRTTHLQRSDFEILYIVSDTGNTIGSHRGALDKESAK